jgi:hypothetical protein
MRLAGRGVMIAVSRLPIQTFQAGVQGALRARAAHAGHPICARLAKGSQPNAGNWRHWVDWRFRSRCKKNAPFRNAQAHLRPWRFRGGHKNYQVFDLTGIF